MRACFNNLLCLESARDARYAMKVQWHHSPPPGEVSNGLYAIKRFRQHMCGSVVVIGGVVSVLDLV